jgi:hypothetical protein
MSNITVNQAVVCLGYSDIRRSDLAVIGKRVKHKYYSLTGLVPNKIHEQIGTEVFSTHVYPCSFIPTIADVIKDYFSLKENLKQEERFLNDLIELSG